MGELAALDIEKWKVKQKEQFQKQLEKLEQHHINTLSDEWNKREKLRGIEYNQKLERISKLEEELKVSLTELKNRQNTISSKEKELEEKSVRLGNKEERLKTLVEDEKRRSNINVQSSTKELRAEASRLKTENSTLANKVKEMEISVTESRNNEKELKKNSSLVDETKAKNEILTQKVSEIEAKLEQSLKEQLFYKKALENSEMKVQRLVEENNKNKSNQIVEQKEEIHRLRSELTLAMHKNEEKLTNLVRLGPNHATSINEVNLPRSARTMSTSSTTSDANTIIVNEDLIKRPEKSDVDAFKYGKHPATTEKKMIDINDHISMLQKEKSMFLKTKVYSEDDPIVKQLSEKIDSLMRIRT